MQFNRQVSRRLHEEHAATFSLFGRLEQMLAAAQGGSAAGTEAHAHARVCVSALDNEVARHFAFEEEELFPRLEAAGEGELCEMLKEEHAAIRDAARRFAAQVGARRTDERGWRDLRVAALELCERLIAHARKEDGSLVPALEDLLGEEDDLKLFAAYAMS
jgi:hemerythrin-like domain-containing protein